MTTPAQNLGFLLVSIFSGQSSADMKKKAGYQAATDNHQADQLLCKAASVSLNVENSETGKISATSLLYHKLSKQASYSPVVRDIFIEPLYSLFAKSSQARSIDVMHKEASALIGGGLIASTAGKLVGSTPGIAKAIGAASLAGGGALGSLAWLLNRDSTQDDAIIEAKREQTKHFRMLAKELRAHLKSKGVALEDPEEVVETKTTYLS